MSLSIRLFLSAALLAACSTTSTRDVTDVGVLCMEPDGTFGVDLQTCLSSSCDTVVERSCVVEATDSGLQVSASATIETSGTTCTDDCGRTFVSCTLDPADPTVDVTYAGTTTTFDAIPSCGM